MNDRAFKFDGSHYQEKLDALSGQPLKVGDDSINVTFKAKRYILTSSKPAYGACVGYLRADVKYAYLDVRMKQTYTIVMCAILLVLMTLNSKGILRGWLYAAVFGVQVLLVILYTVRAQKYKRYLIDVLNEL